MIVTLFFMWYTGFITSYFTYSLDIGSPIPRLYDQLAHGGLVIFISILLGWLYGKRGAILSLILVLLFVYFRRTWSF
ncbi:MAG: hypothetical protein UZ21_OP11001001014 [Microgenomates bacterium OLB22]|nr:MAG: hypothetical protein UZ21_OP11001001014 [Microgenomates bacterium OLB22]